MPLEPHRLRGVRLGLGLSTAQLARAARVSAHLIRKWEGMEWAPETHIPLKLRRLLAWLERKLNRL